MKGEKLKLKEYNQYELRFLSVLVSKELYNQLIRFLYNLRIEQYIWRGDSIILGHPDDKREFVDTKESKELSDYMHTCIEEAKELTAAGDYLDAITHATTAFKEAGIPKGKVIWSDKLVPIPMRPDSIEKEDDKNERQ